MTLIYDHVYPLDLREDGPVFDNVFVGGEENLELAPANGLLLLFASIWRALVHNFGD